jgi:AcrR family transcriptional regulator
MPRAKQRTQHLREHVLQVAVGMLESEGVPGFTTRRIAEEAETSMPAVYELFGDKAGLVREVFFEGFRLLRRRLDRLEEPADARAGLVGFIAAFRAFVRENPVLADVMFSQPFADFDPGPGEYEAGNAVREFIVARVRRCIAEGLVAGDPTDVAHVLIALVQGLCAQEGASLLGRSSTSIERRWRLAIDAMLRGLAPGQTRSHEEEP